MSSSSSSSPTHTFRPIEYSELVTATHNFAESSVIARGKFGNLYAGNITFDASLVHLAIKLFTPNSIRSQEEFMKEVNRLSKLRHCDRVSSILYCIHEQGKMVVYEYLPTGTFHDLLHNHSAHVSWLRRLQICLDVARGLDYLHEADFVHGDIRSSHILLNEECAVAKVAGLGLKKTCPWLPLVALFKHVTIDDVFDSGYLDPFTLATGALANESDVYSFGVLLLEVLCRKPPAFSGALYWEKVSSIVLSAQVFIKRGNLKHITDPDIWAEISPKCLKKFVRIAKRCVNEDIFARPTMAEVIANLEEIVASQEKFDGSNLSRRERFRFLLPVTRTWMFKACFHR